MRVLILTFLFSACAGLSFGQKLETMTIKLYFHNERLNPNQIDCRKVFPTVRTIPKTRSPATAALEELFKGVTADEAAKEFWSFTPAETRGIFKSVKIKRGAAYVNFNKAIYEQMGTATTSCGGGFFSSIEETLKQFPSIKKVFYAIEGNPGDFYEWVQVGECPAELKSCDNRNF